MKILPTDVIGPDGRGSGGRGTACTALIGCYDRVGGLPAIRAVVPSRLVQTDNGRLLVLEELGKLRT